MPVQGSVPSHAARGPCGWPLTGLHVPSEPATSQASHCPAHALSQHTPSVQIPEVQSVAFVQAPPFALLTQRPPVQLAPTAQSWSVLHDVPHLTVAVMHWNGAQLVATGVHAPAGLHVAAAPRVSSSTQVAGAQAFPVAGTRQAPAPSQVPSPAHEPVPILPQSASGSVAAFTGPHVPSRPLPFFAAVQA